MKSKVEIAGGVDDAGFQNFDEGSIFAVAGLPAFPLNGWLHGAGRLRGAAVIVNALESVMVFTGKRS